MISVVPPENKLEKKVLCVYQAKKIKRRGKAHKDNVSDLGSISLVFQPRTANSQLPDGSQHLAMSISPDDLEMITK